MWRRYLRFWRPSLEDDVNDELRFHLESRVEELVGQGLTPDAAAARARDEFGDVEAARDRLARIDRRIQQHRGRRSWWDATATDLRHVLRRLRRAPGITVTIIVTIAIGIGSVVSMYGVMQLLLLAPPPHVTQPERVVRYYRTFEAVPGQPARVTDQLSWPDYQWFARDAATLSSVTVVREFDVVAGATGSARKVHAAGVGPAFARTLGVRPVVGRFFADAETDPVTGTRRVVLGYRFWRRFYDGDAGVIGQTLPVKGRPYEIIGVAPRGFRGVDFADVELWLPLSVFDDGESSPSWWHRAAYSGSGILTIVGRLDAGTSLAQASDEGTRLMRAAFEERYGGSGRRVPRVAITARPVTGALDAAGTVIPEARISAWLVGVAAVVLLVSCANVAGLLILAAMRRRREVAVRMALGESRRRLAAQLVVEGIVLALAGGAAAMAVFAAGGRWLHHLLLPAMAWEPASVIDVPTAMVAIAAMTMVTIIVVLAPLAHTGRDPVSALREGDARSGLRRSRVQTGLLVAQTALGIVLLVGAGLFVRSLQALGNLRLGLEPDHVLVVQLNYAGTGRVTRDIVPVYERALERVRALPGVEGAAVSVNVPFRGASSAGIHFPGLDSMPPLPGRGYPLVNYVSPGFFRTTGTRLLAGRDFAEHERATGDVVIVNEATARLAWPGRSAIGECVQQQAGGPCATVVGVVENARLFQLVDEEPSVLVYRPLDPALDDDRALLVRVPPERIDEMRRTLWQALEALEPGLPYADITTLQSTLDPQMRPWRLGASVFVAFALVALVLAAIGLYAAVAFTVTQRTREIGVRMAIGAAAPDVAIMVVFDGLRVGLGGVAIGLLAAFWSSRFLGDLLFAVSPRDGLVLGAAAVLMLLVTIGASLVPAHRATQVDPLIALQSE